MPEWLSDSFVPDEIWSLAPLLSYYGGPRDTAYDDALRAEFPLAEPLPDCWPLSLPGLGVKYARWLPTSMPFAVGKFTARAVRDRIVAGCAAGRFDVALCDFLLATANFPEPLPVPTMLFQHNNAAMIYFGVVRVAVFRSV